MGNEKSLEDMTLEELEAYRENLKKNKAIAEIKTMETEKAKADKEIKANEAKELKAQIIAEAKEGIINNYLEEHPELKPVDGLDEKGEKVTTTNDNPLQVYYNGYFDRLDTFRTPSNYYKKFDKNEVKKAKFQCYKNQKWTSVGIDEIFANTGSDSGCEDDVSDWSPDDVYAKIVWNTFVCKADLFRIAVKGLAINPGDGLGVQIRAYGAFGSPTETAACTCASCASITFSTYSLTLKQYNLEAIICDKDIWDVGDILMDAYIDAMSDSWAAWFDYQIYNELATATPGTSSSLPVSITCTGDIEGSCCTDSSLLNLYNAVHNVVASLREGTNPYNPDYLIVSPSVAAIFKRMQTPTPMPWMSDVTFDDSGRLTRMCGLNVIEYCRATACTTDGSAVVAIIIDSRRAVGAAFGQQPKMYKFFQTNCNSYRIDWWAYFAVGELDTNAIAHIVNP